MFLRMCTGNEESGPDTKGELEGDDGDGIRGSEGEGRLSRCAGVGGRRGDVAGGVNGS
jgi:hypothetical protein